MNGMFLPWGLSIIVLQPTLELSDKWVIKNSTSRQGAFYADAEQPIQAQREVDGISHKYL